MSDQANKPLMETESVREMLRHPMASEQLKRVASRMIDPGRMLRTITLSFRDNPLLADCEPMSFLGSLMTCASLGLMPNTPLGEAYLVPFRNGALSRKLERDVYEITVIIGYRGWIKLARRSGGLVSIHADVATKEEADAGFFEWEQGSNAHLYHKNVTPDGEPAYVYSIAKLKDGEAFVVWPYSKVLDHRDRFSQAYRRAREAAKDKRKAWMLEQTPWVAHESAMARKTMVLQLCRWLDLTVEAESAMAVDESRRLDYVGFALESHIRPGDIPEPLTEAEADSEGSGEGEGAEGEAADEEPAQGKAAPKAQPAKQAAKAEPAKASKATSGAKQTKSDEKKAGSGAKKAGSGEQREHGRVDAKRAQRSGADGRSLFEDEAPQDDPFDSVADRIIADIGEAESAEAVNAVLSVWEADLQRMQKQSPANYKRVDEASETATDRLSRGSE